MSLLRNSTIDALLADSLIQTLMRADQVEPQALRALLNGAASRITATRRARAAERSGVVFVRSKSERGRREPDAPLAALRAPRVRSGDCRSALCC
jgi:hypothetical protein